MLDLGLSASDQRVYERGLAESHDVRVEITIRDRSERPLSTLIVPNSPDLVSGQVVIDGTDPAETPSRQLQCVVLDPDRRLVLDPDSPADSALWISHFVEVVRLDHIVELGTWVGCPVFWGPLTRFDRQGRAEVHLEAQGKEALGIDPFLLRKTLKRRKGTRVTGFIQALMERQGETRFDIPTLGKRLPKTASQPRGTAPWERAHRLAERHFNQQLFYDARGRLRMRPEPEGAVYDFQEGDTDTAPGTILEVRRDAWGWAETRNALLVTGKPPKGKKKAPTVWVEAPADHPLSAQKNARGTRPRYMVGELSLDFSSKAKLRREGRRKLGRILRVAHEVEMAAMVVPHIELEDPAGLRRSDGTYSEFPFRSGVVPLDDAPMQVGSVEQHPIRR